MLYSGTDPESCITEYTLVYEDKTFEVGPSPLGRGTAEAEGECVDHVLDSRETQLQTFFFITLKPRVE